MALFIQSFISQANSYFPSTHHLSGTWILMCTYLMCNFLPVISLPFLILKHIASSLSFSSFLNFIIYFYITIQVHILLPYSLGFQILYKLPNSKELTFLSFQSYKYITHMIDTVFWWDSCPYIVSMPVNSVR